MSFASMWEDIQDRYYSSMADRAVTVYTPRIGRYSDSRSHERAEMTSSHPRQMSLVLANKLTDSSTNARHKGQSFSKDWHHAAGKKKRLRVKKRTDVWRSPMLQNIAVGTLDGSRRIVVDTSAPAESRRLSKAHNSRDIVRERQQHSINEYEREFHKLLNVFQAPDVRR